MDLLISVGLASVAVLFLEVLRLKVWQPRWALRELSFSTSVRWLAIRAILAVLIAVGISMWWGEPFAAVTLGSVSWLGLVATETDLIGRRIPREPCWTVLVFGIVGGALSGSIAGAGSFIFAFIAIGFILFLLALITKGGLGSGDVRLFLAMSTLAWWIGAVPMISGLLIASIVQAVIRVVLMLSKRGSKYMPFGPALSLGALSAAVLWPPASGGSCAEWFGLLPC